MSTDLNGRVALETGAARGRGSAHAVRLGPHGADIPSPWDQIAAEASRDTIDTNIVSTWNTVMTGAHHVIADAIAWPASDNSKSVIASQISISLGVAYC